MTTPRQVLDRMIASREARRRRDGFYADRVAEMRRRATAIAAPTPEPARLVAIAATPAAVPIAANDDHARVRAA